MDISNGLVTQSSPKHHQALFGAGKPLLEETVFGGPFVMSNPQQLLEAQLRFRRGEMGALESSA